MIRNNEKKQARSGIERAGILQVMSCRFVFICGIL